MKVVVMPLFLLLIACLLPSAAMADSACVTCTLLPPRDEME